MVTQVLPFQYWMSVPARLRPTLVVGDVQVKPEGLVSMRTPVSRCGDDQVYWNHADPGVVPALTQAQVPQAEPGPWYTPLLRLFGP